MKKLLALALALALLTGSKCSTGVSRTRGADGTVTCTVTVDGHRHE